MSHESDVAAKKYEYEMYENGTCRPLYVTF